MARAEQNLAPDAHPSVLEESAHIGQYDLLFELAQGGMGAVYLGRATGARAGALGFERLVAVKRLHPHLLSNPESVRRFLEEASVAAKVHHANVVGVHQVGRDERGHFLVQDYVEGDTLEGLIDASILRRRKLPPPIVLRIAVDALAGLHAVHQAEGPGVGPLGIVHRDVAPPNLLIGRDGVTRLADFGIAKYAQSSVVTDTRYLQGRVLYMPPEYLHRQPVDLRFDIYGLGITLWIALNGGPPWPEASDAQIVRLATTEGIPALSAGGLAVAPPIEELVAKACHRDPARRFQSARAMLDAIEALGRDTGWIATHAEVAELVESLVGRALAARRAAITRTSERALIGSTDSALSITARASSPAAPRRLGMIAFALIALLFVGAALVFFAIRVTTPAPPVQASIDEPPRAVASTTTTIPSAVALAASASAAALPSATVHPPETPRGPVPPVRAAASVLVRATASATAPAVPTVPTVPTGPAVAPTTIATTNPYH